MGKLLPKKVGKMFGFVSESGTLEVPYVYNEVGEWSEGLIFVKREKWAGFLTDSGDEVAGLMGYKWKQTPVFQDSLCVLIKPDSSGDDKWGCIDMSGKIVIPFTYDCCRFVGEKLWLVKNKNYKGLFSYDGEVVDVSQFEVSEIPYRFGLLGISKEGKYGLQYWGSIDTTGKVVIPPEYESISIQASCPIVIVKRKGLYGLISSQGQELLPIEYDYIGDFFSGVAVIKKNDKWGIVNADGEVVASPIYNEINDIGCSRISIKDVSGKWGIIDTSGKTIVPCKYIEIGIFSEGLCPVRKDGIVNSTWGFVNETGKLVIGCRFAEVGSFQNGKCRVKRTGAVLGDDYPWGRIDQNGVLVEEWDDNTLEYRLGPVRAILKILGVG